MKKGKNCQNAAIRKDSLSLDADALAKAIAFLVEHFSAYAVYLFGTASRNSLRADSDVDLAFSSFKDADALSCFEAAQVLADILGRDVDLVNLKNVSTVFRMQVIATGKRIYCNETPRVMREEMIAYKSYAMLNEERKEIMETNA